MKSGGTSRPAGKGPSGLPVSRAGQPARRRRSRAPAPRPDVLARAESACFYGATSLALVGTPVAMGGRHPLGHAVLTLAALAAVASWLIRAWRDEQATWRLGIVDALLLVAFCIGIVQVVPLSETVIRTVSPKLIALLPGLDGGPGSLWRWDRLSLAPGETLAGLGILLAQGTFLAVLAQRTKSVQDVEAVLGATVVATVLLATLGVVQYLFGNGSYLWFYEFPYNDTDSVVKGTFTNRNHFAGFLATGAGATLWWAIGRGRVPPAAAGRIPLGIDAAVGRWLLVAAVAFAAVSSLSRGGCLALAAAIAVSLAVTARSRAWHMPAIVGGVGAAGLLGVALAIHGQDRLARRFAALIDLRQGDLFGSRSTVWRAAWSAMRDFPWLGTGVGTHAEVSPLYMPPSGSIVFTHAESSYLTLGVETGFIGLAVAVAAVVIALMAAAAGAAGSDDRERRATAALAAGIVASAVHAVVDFVWFVPACSTLALTLGCCTIGLASARASWLPAWQVRVGRPGGLIAGCAMVILLCGSGIRQLAAAAGEVAWERSIKQSQALEAAATAAQSAASRSVAPQPDTTDLVQPSFPGETAASAAYAPGFTPAPDATLQELADALDARIASLESAVARRPDHPRAWAELARARVDRFGLQRSLAGSAIGLVDLRLAARGRFASAAEFDGWVRRAAGPGYGDLQLALRDAVEAIRFAPLSGEAWCVVGNLAFLSHREDLAAACMAQAGRVRPTSSLVLFECANQAILEGDDQRAAALWRASFAADRGQRGRIICLLLPRIASTDACRLLEPDLDGLREIESAWERRESAAELCDVRSRRLAAVLADIETSPPADRCRLLLEAADIERKLGRSRETRQRLEDAIAADPASFPAHRALAEAAIAAADWGTARRELEWCLLRRPDSPALKRMLEKLEKPGTPAGDDRAENRPEKLRRL